VEVELLAKGRRAKNPAVEKNFFCIPHLLTLLFVRHAQMVGGKQKNNGTAKAIPAFPASECDDAQHDEFRSEIRTWIPGPEAQARPDARAEGTPTPLENPDAPVREPDADQPDQI